MRLWAFVMAAALMLPGAQAVACAAPAELQALRGAVLAGFNAERARAGGVPLHPSPALEAAAQYHACDIARRQRLSHRGGLFSSLPSRLRRAGYTFSMANENLAMGQTSPAQVMQSWMASTGHRANILAGPARHLGVGVALGPDGLLYWVTVGAAPR
ncbi:MAG: CAP domain-containing protein [Pararhodobacter sp.]|nr:CAP domain-containing protein [Pararhodobacter sp.]